SSKNDRPPKGEPASPRKSRQKSQPARFLLQQRQCRNSVTKWRQISSLRAELVGNSLALTHTHTHNPSPALRQARTKQLDEGLERASRRAGEGRGRRMYRILAVALWCFLQAEGRHPEITLRSSSNNNGNFLDNDKWLSTVSQYDKDKYWNKFR
ncbi:hypothetical protein E2320_015406, partial [Naja naja]